MTIIEGFGDEIIHIAIGIGVICLSVLAWWSTHIRDVALYRTIVIVERNHNNNNNNSVVDNNQIEPLAGIPVSRNVHTTLANEAESDTEDSSSREQTPTEDNNEATPTADNGEATPTAETQPDPSLSPSLQSERPLLVGDYVNPSLQNPPVPSESTDNTPTSSPGDTTDTSADIRIRLKYLNDEERIVDGKPNELLGDFKKRHFRSELSSNKVVRLIYNGHILQQDNAPLRSCGLFNNCVIHCLVHPRRNQPSSGESARRSHSHHSHGGHHHSGGGGGSPGVNTLNNGTGGSGAAGNDRGADEWGDLGGIFYFLISIVLCSAWYWRFQHSHLFSFTATAALSSITAIFSIFVFSITFFHNDEIPIEIM